MYYLLMVAAFFVFGALSVRFACNRSQASFFGRETPGNALYFLTQGYVYSKFAVVITALLSFIALSGFHTRYSGLNLAHRYHLPAWAQLLAVVLVSDVWQYWAHRAFHNRWLWPFHAIHHAAREPDWITLFRNHPLNFLGYSTTTALIIAALGFSPVVLLYAGVANFAHSALVHANLGWGFGPLRYVFTSPVTHRWHHCLAREARDKNFAPVFSLLDVIFGTFYAPIGRLPEVFGAEGVPENFIGQMAHPFVALLGMLGTETGNRTGRGMQRSDPESRQS